VNVDIARTLDDALSLIAERPGAEVINGGTDLMVEINFGRTRPEALIAIDRVEQLRGLSINGNVTMGAGVTFAAMLERDCGSVAMREAARTVGSPGPRCMAAPGDSRSPPSRRLPSCLAWSSRTGCW